MAWRQIRAFDPQKMGNRPGWCEQNAREGFGIPNGTFPSAKADMASQVANGTFHVELPPNNISVPVFFDTSSKNEHVMVADHGIYYSDKKRLTSIAGWKPFGWGELMDGVRVVEWVDEPLPPQPTPGFLPAKGFWAPGDNDARVGQLASFMRAVFPAYTSAKALGNYYGPYLTASITTFQRKAKADGKYNGAIDGKTGPLTYAALKSYGFKG